MIAVVGRRSVRAIVVPGAVHAVAAFAAILEALENGTARSGVDRADAAPPALVAQPERAVQRMELSREQQARLCGSQTCGGDAGIVFTEIDEATVRARRADRMREAAARDDVAARPGFPDDAAGRRR